MQRTLCPLSARSKLAFAGPACAGLECGGAVCGRENVEQTPPARSQDNEYRGAAELLRCAHRGGRPKARRQDAADCPNGGAADQPCRLSSPKSGEEWWARGPGLAVRKGPYETAPRKGGRARREQLRPQPVHLLFRCRPRGGAAELCEIQPPAGSSDARGKSGGRNHFPRGVQ